MIATDPSVEQSVTLIIPTVHSRAPLFSRVLRYLDAAGFRCPIIVSDHSETQHQGVIAEAARRHGALRLQLLQHSPDLHFLERLRLCAEATATPYVHLHADDDFLIRGTLDVLLREMASKPGCAAAMGLNVHIRADNRELNILSKTSVEQSEPFHRLVAQLETYSSVLYALRRREEFIASMAFTVPRCPDVQFWQYLESCVAVLNGSIVVVEQLHYVREVHPGKWSATLVREQSPDHFPYLILSPELSSRIAAFRAALIEACQSRNIAVETAALDRGLIHLLNRGFAAMGLPPKLLAREDRLQEINSRLASRIANANEPARIELERIIALIGGSR